MARFQVTAKRIQQPQEPPHSYQVFLYLALVLPCTVRPRCPHPALALGPVLPSSAPPVDSHPLPDTCTCKHACSVLLRFMPVSFTGTDTSPSHCLLAAYPAALLSALYSRKHSQRRSGLGVPAFPLLPFLLHLLLIQPSSPHCITTGTQV